MFAVFLKAKLELEGKLSSLQSMYIALLRAPLGELRFNPSNDDNKASEIVKEKLELLTKIKEEYNEAIDLNTNLCKEILEAKEVTEDIEQQLDSLYQLLGLEIPEELKFKEKPRASTKPKITDSPEEDKENSRIYQQDDDEEEEEEASDKENQNRDEHSSDPGSAEYFSPNIKILNSFKNVNGDCYTPAIKSHSKVPTLRRQL